jgi:peptidoglycan/LPS O-acetylase OafA/YrhL
VNARADRFFLLDSLRGLAALMVLATHVAWVSGALAPSASVRPFQARLEAAFAIFFVISGFLLYRPFVKARLLDRDQPSTRAYAWRRFLRIVPAFWVAVTAIALWQGLHVFTLHEAIANYGFLQLYRGSSPLNVIPQAWTLCVEVAFYTGLPLWAWLMRRLPGRSFDARLRSELVAVSVVVLGSLAYNAVLVYGGFVHRIPFEPTPVLAALPGYMDHIGFGMLLAVVSVWLERRDAPLPQPLAVLARFPSLCFAIAIAAIWVGATQIGLSGAAGELYSPTQYMVRHVLNSVIAVAVVIPAVFGDARKGATRRVLANPVLVYIGLISYGFYLYHLAVIDQLFRWKLYDLHFAHPYLRWYVVALGGAIVLGSASYYLVERPALSLKGLVGPRPQPARDEAIVEPAPVAPVTAPPTS